MTIQEALKWMKTIKGLYKPLLKEANEACDVAIQALEKQLPNKYEIKDGVPYCPCCGEIATTDTGDSFLDYWLRFCNKCGQKLGSDVD